MVQVAPITAWCSIVQVAAIISALVQLGCYHWCSNTVGCYIDHQCFSTEGCYYSCIENVACLWDVGIIMFVKHYAHVFTQNIQDWILAFGVLVFIVIDLTLLSINLTAGEILGASEAVLVPNKDKPRTVTGVRLYIII